MFFKGFTLNFSSLKLFLNVAEAKLNVFPTVRQGLSPFPELYHGIETEFGTLNPVNTVHILEIGTY